MKYLFAYLILINILSVIVCIKDKSSSRRRGKRVRERTLFVLSAIGGSIGMYATMLIIRHKTKHIRFMLGIPAIIVIQAVVIIFLLNTFC